MADCFVIMPFDARFTGVLSSAIEPAAKECSLSCLRADQDVRYGVVFEQVRDHIRNCRICIADLSGNSSNVLTEVGIALAMGKPVLMITRDKFSDVPFDLRHYRIIGYSDTGEGLERLRTELCTALRATLPLGSPAQLLKEMLLPSSLGNDTGPFVIAASPLSYREALRIGGGYPRLRPTTADHVGIRGLIHAFGLIFGLNYVPELINPGDYQDSAIGDPKSPMDLYCIGSPKANRWTGLVLKKLYERWEPQLEFRADPASDDLRNVNVTVVHGGDPYRPPGYQGQRSRRVWDFGLIIRAPHPWNENRMVLVLAGRSALGTHAACAAATDPAHVSKIKRILQDDYRLSLDDHQCAFWAVAHVETDGEPHYRVLSDKLAVTCVEPFRPARSFA